MSDRLAAIIREAGGETKAGCEAVGLDLDADGAAAGVSYRTSRDDASPIRAEAPVIFANAAPHRIAEMLDEDQREAFLAPYAKKTLSISLMSITFGLRQKPADLGVTHYSTVLIPDWVKALSDYRHSAGLLAEAPGERMPILGVVDYSQIDSGLADDGLYPVSAVCADRVANWDGLDGAAYEARRDAWADAILARLDREWPGFTDAVADRTVATARSMRNYLNTPDGALYGFAMTPPRDGPPGPPMSVETQVKGLWLASSFGGAGGFSGSMGCGAEAARAALKTEGR